MSELTRARFIGRHELRQLGSGMAFDGPSPFDGDPASMYAHEIEDQPPAEVRKALLRAFAQVVDSDYVEVDEAVWAWCAAEMVATALGRPASTDMPEPFAAAASSVPKPAGLVARALAALNVVSDRKRSEVAELWADSGEGTLHQHVSPLRSRLRKGPRPRSTRTTKGKKKAPARRRKPVPGDLFAVPAGEENFLVLYVGHFLPIFGHAFGVFRGTHPASMPEVARAPDRVGRLICVAGVGVSWTHVGNEPALLSLFPSSPEYFHSRADHPDDPQIGPFGSAERHDNYAGERKRKDIVDYSRAGEICVLRHLTEEEAKAIGLLEGDFTNSYDHERFAEALPRLANA